MKKILYFVAAFAAVAMFASCDQKDGNEGTDEGSKVTVATENLVLYLPFEDGAVGAGKGIAFVEKKGSADFTEGFIGKGYTNTSSDAKTEAYLKYSVAADNLFKELKSFTWSAWIKRPATGSGAIFSLNGGTSDWGSIMHFMFDNASTNEETGVVSQQFNGRIDMQIDEAWPAFWPNVNGPEFAQTDKWFQIVRTYDAATSVWNVYVNGVKFGNFVDEEGNPTSKLMYKDAPLGDLNLASETMDAFYVGAWAAIVDGVNNQSWMTYFNGSIDEMRIYNKALSDEEIAKLYQEEALIALE